MGDLLKLPVKHRLEKLQDEFVTHLAAAVRNQLTEDHCAQLRRVLIKRERVAACMQYSRARLDQWEELQWFPKRKIDGRCVLYSLTDLIDEYCGREASAAALGVFSGGCSADYARGILARVGREVGTLLVKGDYETIFARFGELTHRFTKHVSFRPGGKGKTKEFTGEGWL